MIRRTPGDPRPTRPVRAAASPGTGWKTITASASARKQAALTKRTPRALLRRRELGATTTTVANEAEHALTIFLAEGDPTVAVGAFVPHGARADHADRASDLLVLRLDVQEPLKRAVFGDRQDEWRVPQGPGHPATPGPREPRVGIDGSGRRARAAGKKCREEGAGSRESSDHADGVRRPACGFSV